MKPSTDIVDKVVGLTQKFIEAAMPIAKQAYEVGLTTVRVDALSLLIPSFLGVLLSVWLFRKFRKELVADVERYKVEYAAFTKRNNSSYYDKPPEKPDTDSSIVFWFYVMTWIPALLAMFNLLNVWLWVKLLDPQLWLAHIAVERILK